MSGSEKNKKEMLIEKMEQTHTAYCTTVWSTKTVWSHKYRQC